MSLVIPESFRFGGMDFPWGGRIDPKLYQRRKWILASPVVYGPIPVISISTANDIPVELFTSQIDVVVDSSHTAVEVVVPATSVYTSLCNRNHFGVAVSVDVLGTTIGAPGVSVLLGASMSTDVAGVVECSHNAITVATSGIDISSATERRMTVSIRKR